MNSIKMWKSLSLTVLATLILTIPAYAADAPAAKAAEKAVPQSTTTDYKAFLKQFPVGVIATVDGEQPRTRMFQYLWSEADKAYFCTGASKDVYKQMQKNKHVSFSTWDPATARVLSVDGPTTFVNDKALKQRVLDENPGIKAIYKSVDNPEFVVFYIEPQTIYGFDFHKGKQYSKK